MLQGVRRAGPCGTTLATAFGSDLRSVDTLRSSRYALTQPDAFGAGASRDGQAIAASLATIFALHRSVAERRSPLEHSHLQSSWRVRRERSERSVRTQITSFSQLLPNPTIRQPPTASLPKETQRPRCVKHDAARRRISLSRHLLKYVTRRATANSIMKLRRFIKRLRYRCGMRFARFNRKCPTKYVRACLTSHSDAVV